MASLYRKFRPNSFESVIGQEAVTKTLANQIKTGRIGHAYLFTGSRGVGKTTCARIFAKAINCLNPENGSPCEKCRCCTELSSPNMDIIEIDAASNNGVDDARAIRDNVSYPPVIGKYKVYIIDEVHMLTGSAFNALLKTLEEPPAHAVFILATTEAHKLPATILSRCMRFDFRLVSTSEIADRVASIYDSEGKAYERSAVNYIAAAAEGSVRDALSLAETCMSLSQGKLTYADVLAATGGIEKKRIRALFSALSSASMGECLQAVDSLASSGKSMGLIAKEITLYARDLLVMKTAPSLITDSEENVAALKEDAERNTINFLSTVINVFGSVDAELRYSTRPRIVLETACIRCCTLAVTDVAALEERVSRLERNGFSPVREQTAEKKECTMDAKMVWGKVISYFRTSESMRLQTLVGNHRDYEVKNGAFIIWCEDDYLDFCEDDMMNALSRAFAFNGITYEIRVDKKSAIDKDAILESLKSKVGKGVKVNVTNK